MEKGPLIISPCANRYRQPLQPLSSDTQSEDIYNLFTKSKDLVEYESTDGVAHEKNAVYRWSMDVDSLPFEDFALDVISRCFPAGAEVLEEEYKFLQHLTNRKIGGVEVVSTMPVREAVRYYTHRLYGIFYKHYPYASVNKFLIVSQKLFLKKLACWPERVTREDFKRLRSIFSWDDTVHYVLLAFEARRNVELIYVTKAFADYENI
eukprot:GHVL01024457.1.p2 GENE.GHVL01024457.1~~GHVL01024457.1.p2  ORF type:complete len:207 (+),score=31.34 GHVL01024457.1:989-1609(+)